MTNAIVELEHHSTPKLDRDWAVAWRRAGRKFTKSMIEPDLATRTAAVVCELQLKGTRLFTGEITRGDLEHWLEELYTGRCGAKLAADGRVMTWAQRNFKQENRNDDRI